MNIGKYYNTTPGARPADIKQTSKRQFLDPGERYRLCQAREEKQENKEICINMNLPNIPYRAI